MTIEYRTIADFRQMILDAVTVYQPEESVIDGSDAWVMANSVAVQLHRQQLRQSEIGTWITPLFAEGTKLDEHGDRWLPSASRRGGATKWIGQVDLTGTGGLVGIAPGVVMASGSGVQYITTAACFVSLGVTQHVAAEAVEAGTAANLPDATPLTLVAPPGGVSPDSVIHTTTTDAVDVEADEDYRERVLNATRNRPASGNAAHVMEWALSVDGVGTAFVYPRWFGLCTFAVVPLGPPGSRVSGVTPSLIAAVEAAIEEERPSGHTQYVYAPTAVATDVALTVTPMTGYSPDWVGTLTTAAGTTATSIVTTANPATVGLVAGMRVVIEVGAFSIGEERIVDTVNALGFTVTEAFSAVPAVPTTVYPGGLLWQPIRDAMEALFDTLGPARSSAPGTSERMPLPRTSWHSELYLSDIFRAADGVEGVLGVGITAPAADIDPTSAPGSIVLSILTLRNMRITWA